MKRPPDLLLDDTTARYAAMSPAERAEHLRQACRAAERLLSARSDAAVVRALRQNPPESTVKALERLRRSFGDGTSGRAA